MSIFVRQCIENARVDLDPNIRNLGDMAWLKWHEELERVDGIERQLAALRAQLADAQQRLVDLDVTMPCGHKARFLVGADCVVCQLAASEAARGKAQEVLRRYVAYEEDGAESLYAEFGAPKYEDSSVWMTEWLERVLRGPARAALAPPPAGGQDG